MPRAPGRIELAAQALRRPAPSSMARRQRETRTMSETLRPLLLDLVAFVAEAPRPYAEVLDAWRTNCPRLTIWEDAVDAGWVVLRDGRVEATAQGLQALALRRGPH